MKNRNMKYSNLVLFSVLILTLSSQINARALVQHEAHENTIEYTANNVIPSTFALDGDSSDWNGIVGISLTLTSLDGTKTVDIEIRIAYNSSDIAMLYIVHDDYDYTPNDNHLAAHIAVEWGIDTAAGPHMGADSFGSSTGKVDLWHWEIQTPAGTEVGGSETSGDGGDDPVGNLDDEWATTSFNRNDDENENSIRGNWNHTGSNGVNGTVGIYYFEMIRPLQTSDAEDTQFEEGETYNLSLAYWDPDEAPNGWTNSGHMVSVETYDSEWISVTLGDPTVVKLTATEKDLTSITLDGDPSDWNDVAGLSLTLTSIDYARTVDVEFRIAFDSSDIALLYIVHDDYDYSPNDNHLASHIAVQWGIDTAAGPQMGTDSTGASTGKVDIWHWEIQTSAGTEVGGDGTSTDGGNDPVGNLDDEWATTPYIRHDDGAENSIRGNWNHTGSNGPNGTVGTYYFEMKRSLSTVDENDTQFAEGKAYNMALAYWDPDETDNGWTDSGHMVSPESVGFLWMEISLGNLNATITTTTTRGTVGFSTILPIILSIGAIAIIPKKYHRKKS